MSVDGTAMIGHDMQWFFLFVGTHIVTTHGDSCGLSIQCNKELPSNLHEVRTSGTLLTQ